jgi:hypothetical protein
MRWVSKERITTRKRIENPQGRKTSHPTTKAKEQKKAQIPETVPNPPHDQRSAYRRKLPHFASLPISEHA